MLKSFLTTLTLTLAMTATAARADDITRYRGTIEKVDGAVVTIKPRVGESLTVSMAPDVKVLAASTGRLSRHQARQLHRHGGDPAAGWNAEGTAGHRLRLVPPRHGRRPLSVGSRLQLHHDQRRHRNDLRHRGS